MAPGKFSPGRDARKFTGMVGRQSKKVGGKQGIHHHPMESQLGEGLTGGMPVKDRKGAYVPPALPAAPPMAWSKK